MSNFHDSPWRDEAKVEQLKTLVAEKLSSGQIAKQLAITRSAVIGKAHRLGLSLDSHHKNRRDNPTRKHSYPEFRKKQGDNGGRERRPKAPLAQRTEVSAPLGLSIYHIKGGRCLFEITGGDDPAHYKFCGLKTETGRSWCPYHCTVVFA